MFDKEVTVPGAVAGELEELCFRRAFELQDEAAQSSGSMKDWAQHRADALFSIGLALQPKRGPANTNPPAGIWRPAPKP